MVYFYENTNFSFNRWFIADIGNYFKGFGRVKRKVEEGGIRVIKSGQGIRGVFIT